MAYEDAQLAAVLNNAKRIVIVGLSRRPESPSHEVAVYRKSKGYQVIPVNRMYTEIFGTRSYQSVSDIKRGAWVIMALLLATIATAVSFHNFLQLPPMIGMMTGLAYLQLFGFYLRTTHARDMPNVQ